jgi:O-antigen/teichoic acid export membrane protein
MNRSKRFAHGLVLGYLNQALVMAAGLLLTPFYLRHIGQRDYGLWLIGLQFLSYLMLADFGIVALLPREVAYSTGYVERDGEDRVNRLVGQTIRIVFCQAVLLALAVIFVWFYMRVRWDDALGPITVILVVFTGLFPFRIFQAILNGLQDLAFLGKTQIFTWMLATAVMIVLVLKNAGLYALAAGWAVGQVTATGVYYYRVRTRHPYALPSPLPRLSRALLAQRLTGGFWVSVAQVAQVLVNGTDLLLVGRALGASAVVPYACTGKLVTVLANQPSMIMQMAAPGLSQMKTGDTADRLRQVSTTLTQVMLAISGAIGCMVLAANQAFVKAWVGPTQYHGGALTLLLVLNMLLRHWNTTTVYAIFCFGYERRTSLTTLLDGVVTVALSIVLIQRYGGIGAPMGSIVGVSLVSLPWNLAALARESQVSAPRLLKPLLPWLWRFLAVAGASILWSSQWTPSGPVEIAGMVLAVGVVYAALVGPVLMRSALRQYLPPAATRVWDAIVPRPVLETSVR